MLNSPDVQVRPLAARDSFEALTALLHRASAPLAAEGQCFIAEAGGAPVSTVTVCGPYDVDTAHFHQFAVDPALQGRGVGRLLLETIERWAPRQGYKRMAQDTALPATALRTMYARMGDADFGQVQWEGKTYGSVVMQKAMDSAALTALTALTALGRPAPELGRVFMLQEEARA